MDNGLLQQACEVAVDLDPTDQGAIELLFLLDAFSRGLKGVCCAKARTLGERLGCSDRSIRRRFAKLVELGLAAKVRRKCRSSWRETTALGRSVLKVLNEGGPLVVSTRIDAESRRQEALVSGHASAHKGKLEPRSNLPKAKRLLRKAACPGPTEPCEPKAYQVPRAAGRLSERTWATIAEWMKTARSVSWARCKITHRVFSGVVFAVWRSAEFSAWHRAMVRDGRVFSAEDLVRMAIEDANRKGRDFGTVETALKLISKIVFACVEERRLPGKRRLRT